MRRTTPDQLIASTTASPVDPTALIEATAIVEDVRRNGREALRRYAGDLDGLEPNGELVFTGDDLRRAFETLPLETQGLLQRTASRIESFARAQLELTSDLDIAVPGGRAGHIRKPVASVGAYAPGGRYPLPSTVLMTVVPASVAGVGQIWAASPRPTQVTLAAAHIGGADGLLSLGGAQAIAALAFGTVSPRCDLIVGPGNKWVTAAKKHLFGEVGIDGLAGPSEILVIADDDADPILVARDLLAQAEHDTDARPLLVALSSGFIDEVEQELERQLADLPTMTTARNAICNGLAVVATDLAHAASLSNSVAPEHLALHSEAPGKLAKMCTSYGALFIGPESAEVHADYGIGPNHVLPTGGSARFQSGLSVTTYLRTPTWLRLDGPCPIVGDVTALARLEGLEAHARAATGRERGS